MADVLFDVRDESHEAAEIVLVSGEVDLATAASLKERLDSAIDRVDKPLVVDLLGVTFIDSTALGVLIGAWKRCQELNRPMSVVVEDPRILKVFQITGLTDLFVIHETIEEAIGS